MKHSLVICYPFTRAHAVAPTYCLSLHPDTLKHGALSTTKMRLNCNNATGLSDDFFERIIYQEHAWPEAGLSSFSRIYDGDIILVSKPTDWDWNVTVELCSRPYLPCSLSIKGNGVSSKVHKVYRRGSGVISCQSAAACTGIEFRGVTLQCNHDVEAYAGPLQVSGVELVIVNGAISDCRSARWGGAINAVDRAQVSIVHSQVSRCSSQVTLPYNDVDHVYLLCPGIS